MSGVQGVLVPLKWNDGNKTLYPLIFNMCSSRLILRKIFFFSQRDIKKGLKKSNNWNENRKRYKSCYRSIHIVHICFSLRLWQHYTLLLCHGPERYCLLVPTNRCETMYMYSRIVRTCNPSRHNYTRVTGVMLFVLLCCFFYFYCSLHLQCFPKLFTMFNSLEFEFFLWVIKNKLIETISGWFNLYKGLVQFLQKYLFWSKSSKLT